jgi:hypothetical protein
MPRIALIYEEKLKDRLKTHYIQYVQIYEFIANLDQLTKMLIKIPTKKNYHTKSTLWRPVVCLLYFSKFTILQKISYFEKNQNEIIYNRFLIHVFLRNLKS